MASCLQQKMGVPIWLFYWERHHLLRVPRAKLSLLSGLGLGTALRFRVRFRYSVEVWD